MSKAKTQVREETVEYLAKLAKLDLDRSETKLFSSQLKSILDFIDELSKLETEGVEPTSQITGLENVFREDKIQPSLTQKEALSNAKNQYKGYFLINAILEE